MRLVSIMSVSGAEAPVPKVKLLANGNVTVNVPPLVPVEAEVPPCKSKLTVCGVTFSKLALLVAPPELLIIEEAACVQNVCMPVVNWPALE